MTISTNFRYPRLTKEGLSESPQMANAKLFEREIERAIRRQSLDSTGASKFIAWVRTSDRRSVLSWAGIKPSDRAFELIEKRVVDEAKRGKIDLFGKRRCDASHQTVRTF